MEYEKFYFCRFRQKNQKEGSILYHKKLAVLSNFEDKHPIKLDDGKIALTAEHYFQAYKHKGNPTLFNKILQARTKTGKVSPCLAKRLGRGSSKTGVGRLSDSAMKKWNEDRLDVMYKVTMAKFVQHSDLKEILLSTGDSQLVENAPWDSYWGIGKDGNGQNMLGKTLMKVREDIRSLKN